MQKEVPALVFSWQLPEIFNNNLFKEHCYKKRGQDIYRKPNYVTFTLPKFLYFSIVLSDNRLYVVLSVEKNH